MGSVEILTDHIDQRLDFVRNVHHTCFPFAPWHDVLLSHDLQSPFPWFRRACQSPLPQFQREAPSQRREKLACLSCR